MSSPRFPLHLAPGLLGLAGAALLLTAAPEPGHAQAFDAQSWIEAQSGDGLWLTEPLAVESVERGTWIRYNNVDALAFASPGDVIPIPVEADIAFDPGWSGAERVYAELIMKVDGQVVFGERIPTTGYFPAAAVAVTAHRTAMLGISGAEMDNELTVELIGVLYNDTDDTMVDADNMPTYAGTVYQGHPYYGGAGIDATEVLRETRRVQHLRIDNPFSIDSLAISSGGACPGPVNIGFTARSAYSGRGASHPSAAEITLMGLEDAEGWDFSPETSTLTLGASEHRRLEFTGTYRDAEPCEVAEFATGITLLAQGAYSVMPSGNWPSATQDAVRTYWQDRIWSAPFMIGSGIDAEPMPAMITLACMGEGENCPEAALGDPESEARFANVESTPRRHDGPLQTPEELTVYLPAGAVEGETVKGTVVASGQSAAALSPASIEQIVVNNQQVAPEGDTLRDEEGGMAAQQFTTTLTGGGGTARVELATSDGPVELAAFTVMASESSPAAQPSVLLANIPDLFSWNVPGQALWAPGSSIQSPAGMLDAAAYEPSMSSLDPTAPIITGVRGGTALMVEMADADLQAAATGSPYNTMGLLDSLSEYYRVWALDPYKNAEEIIRGTAPVYLQPGGVYTFNGPVPTKGGIYGVQDGEVVKDEGRGYAAGWDPNKNAVENLVLVDPKTGEQIEKLQTLSQSSMGMSAYIPEDLPAGDYGVAMETSNGETIDTGKRTVSVNIQSENDKLVQRGTQGRIDIAIEGHDQGKEKEQEEEDEEGNPLRPELRFFWNGLQMLPGDWTRLGYAPRRGIFLAEFTGSQRPDAGQQEEEAAGGQESMTDPDKKLERLWSKDKAKPEMFVTVYNMTPGIIRFESGLEVMELPVYAETTQLTIPFTGLATGTYAVRIEVKEPLQKDLDTNQFTNLDPEKNPLMKMANTGWQPEALEDFSR